MEVLHVMTPAEWGKPIDVDEKWIHFVDENVKASKFRISKFDEWSSLTNQNFRRALRLRAFVPMAPAIGPELPRSRLEWLMVHRVLTFSKKVISAQLKSN